MAGTYGHTGKVETITVSTAGEYEITADGAQGGGASSATGGYGAQVSGEFALAADEQIEIVVGGQGGDSFSSGGGGGGGSFVFEVNPGDSLTPLVIAGGGGGAFFEEGGGGVFETNGGSGNSTADNSSSSSQIGGHNGGSPGTIGNQNTVGGRYGGGGGNGNGGGGGGVSFAGGSGVYSNDGGGFGGGGGGGSDGGGGGGGFGGGGGGGSSASGNIGHNGGGGGSFDGGTNQVLQAGVNIGNGSVTITLEAAVCYLPGTRILTPNGEVPVETLKRGDPVITAEGVSMPIRWMALQTISTRFAEPMRSLPIRIHAGALGDDLPKRDLFVSPGHALMIDGVLIEAGALVNGSSIARHTAVPETFVYYHIELADHSLILAEGVPAETFIDNVTRMAFDNWDEHEALPDAAPIAELDIPRAKSHRQVPMATRRRLAALAEDHSGILAAKAA